MADSVTIKLSIDERQDIPFPHREIVLDKKNNSIVVGRASKAEKRGLLSLPSNAWFRSPVMSRNHAEIIANLDDKRVMIKDLNSLHGTVINDKDRLEKGEFREIVNGDKLQLGVAIFRGPDSFPPTTLKVGIEYREKRPDIPTSTFQVPDCSDVEDDYSSDSNSDGRASSGREPQPRCIPAIIDLTELPVKTTHTQIIDLSSRPSSPLSIVALDDSTYNFDFPSSNIGSPIPDQTLEQEQSSRVASPDLSVTSPNLGALSPASFRHDGSSDYEGSVIPSADGEDEEMMEGHFRLGDAESNDGEASDMDSIDGQSNSSGLSDPEDYPDSERDEESEGYDEDVHDEYSSEDEEHTGLAFPDEEFRSAFWDEIPVEPVTRAPQPLEPPKGLKNLDIRKLLNDDGVSYAKEAARLEDQAHYSAPTIFNPTITKPSYPWIACPPQTEKPKNVADVLGGGIGKEEFFAAREHNKFRVEIQGTSEPRSSTVHSLCNEGPFSLASVASVTDRFLKRTAEDLQEPERSPQLPTVIWTNTADPAEPIQPVEPIEAPESAPPAKPVVSDNTATFTEATKSSEEAPVDDAPAGKAINRSLRRSHLGISDIVEGSLPAADPVDQGNTTVVSNKRKADDISNITVQEEQWASDVSPNGGKEVVAVSDSTQPSPTVKNKTGASLPEYPVSREIDGRPAKRLRHIAERVGYAALGGVTAGAVIFGTLVYTAPTFV